MIIGLDVGGTHTDVVLLNEEGVVKDVKVLTDSYDLFNTVLSGLETITSDIKSEQIERVVFSTTLTTNAIVQGKVPEVGIIVSSGPGIDPEFFRTGSHYYSVSGSIDHRGRKVEKIDQTEIEQVGKQLQSSGIEYVGVIGKFSSRNPEHEIQIKEILKGSFKKIFLGHRVSGNLNFPRRISTAYLNTTVYPIHKEFFEAVKKSLDKKGLKVPIHILKADGGTMNFESSIDFPAHTILSGPAASVMGAVSSAPQEDVVALDIGGTTTDLAVLVDRSPLLDPLGIELGGHKTLIRSLKTSSIGLGGDSAIKVKNSKLEIGPERVGPAMAFGGAVPTPTDALFILDKITDGDRDKSVKGLTPIATEFGISLKETSCRILNQICKEILSHVGEMIDRINSKPVYTLHEIREGYIVKPDKIIISGGPAPYFAKRLEDISDYSVSAVPRWHVANAIGAALARTTSEVTLLADTESGIAAAPEENFSQTGINNFSKQDAINTAFDLLKQKALEKGADAENLEMEVLEEQEFNIVRGFSTQGKNIRVKVQVKPGLINKYAGK